MTRPSEGEVAVLGQNDRDLSEGQRVGEYVVEEKIGEGGFGTVFRAAHPLIGKVVAIKVLARQYSADAEMVSRFVAEARAVNQIRHRHIIDIFSFGQLDDGRHYYVMELLNGQPLDEYLAERGRLTMTQAIPILRALARALDSAHGKGIAHRDLKPENVFLAQDSDGEVFPKLLDFGIAKLLGDRSPGQHKTRTGAPMGTPAYMSPEQCRGRDVDHRTDIYAFGIMAYQLLAGTVPFHGDDYMEVLLKQIGDAPAPPSSHYPELPASVDRGILWMLAKDPSARPPNLVTAVRALEDAAVSAGFDVPAAPAPTGAYAAPTGPPMGPQPTPSLVAGAAAMANAPTAFQTTNPTGSPGTLGDLPPAPQRGSRTWLIGVAIATALAAGGAAYWSLSGTKPTARSSSSAAPGKAPGRPTGAAPSADAAAERSPVEARLAAPDATPPAPPEVHIAIEGTPEGTEVYGPAGLLGTAPGVVQLPRGDREVQLTFRAEGYRTATARVTPNQDRPLAVSLTKKGRRGHGDRPSERDKGDRRGTRDSIEDPFK